jgi:hypothetical protein
MNGTNCHISDYCVIRDKKIFKKDKLLFSGTEDKAVPFFIEAYKHFGLNYPKFYKMDSLCKLGFLSSEILMQNKSHDFSGRDFGIVLYNAASSIDTDRSHQQSINDRNAYYPSPSVFVYTLPNIVIGEICIRHKIYGESAFFITEKFDAGALYHYVNDLFEENKVQHCLAGWVECERDLYDCKLLLIDKTSTQTGGIINFDMKTINEIYSL